jgi:predicted short-subunit dehydrogenase-like oxidoreductase (DUF2520 family)
MNKERVALVAAGEITRSLLAYLPALIAQLGPVKAPTLRVASRIANTLRAGHPVADYVEFEAIAMVLISLPDEIAGQEILSMRSAEVSWSGKTVILCSQELGLEALEPLASAGALTASLSLIGGERDWFLLEGNKVVERQVRPLLPPGGRLTVILPSTKAEYLTAMNCMGTSLMPVLITASAALRKAGFDTADAAAILEWQTGRTIRSYLKFGKKAGREYEARTAGA